jgi:RNA polymerase sigma-70 factor (ECF subfamily)
MTEFELIEQVISGQKNSFVLLVEKYQAIVFRTCMGFTHNKDDADDLTQEVFIKAYQSLQSFKAQSTFSTWLYRIAINTSLNHVRNNSKRSIFERIEDFFGNVKVSNNIPHNDSENPEQLLINEEHRNMVQKALALLPENQRTAIVLSKYDDLSQKEIAQIMDTTEGAVEALIQRAKANLRKNLWKYKPVLKTNSNTS